MVTVTPSAIQAPALWLSPPSSCLSWPDKHGEPCREEGCHCPGGTQCGLAQVPGWSTRGPADQQLQLDSGATQDQTSSESLVPHIPASQESYSSPKRSSVLRFGSASAVLLCGLEGRLCAIGPEGLQSW